MTSTSNPRPARRPPLRRDAIVAAAMRMADGRGVDALTMRALAADLGFEVMSLYNHVDNKDHLLSLMVDAVAGEVPAPAAGEVPLQRVRAHALDTRAAFVRHPWAPPLWLRYTPGPSRVQHMEDLLAALAATDLPSDLAHDAYHAVSNHVLGYTLQAQAMSIAMPGDDPDATARAFLVSISADDHPHTVEHVRQHLDGESGSSFELVLDLILDGIVRLAATR